MLGVQRSSRIGGCELELGLEVSQGRVFQSWADADWVIRWYTKKIMRGIATKYSRRHESTLSHLAFLLAWWVLCFLGAIASVLSYDHAAISIIKPYQRGPCPRTWIITIKGTPENGISSFGSTIGPLMKGIPDCWEPSCPRLC